MNCVVIHVSSIFEFGAVFHDCLSVDPQGTPPFSPVLEKHRDRAEAIQKKLGKPTA